MNETTNYSGDLRRESTAELKARSRRRVAISWTFPGLRPEASMCRRKRIKSIVLACGSREEQASGRSSYLGLRRPVRRSRLARPVEGLAAGACGAARAGVGSLKHTMEVDRYAQRCNDWR